MGEKFGAWRPPGIHRFSSQNGVGKNRSKILWRIMKVWNLVAPGIIKAVDQDYRRSHNQFQTGRLPWQMKHENS